MSFVEEEYKHEKPEVVAHHEEVEEENEKKEADSNEHAGH